MRISLRGRLVTLVIMAIVPLLAMAVVAVVLEAQHAQTLVAGLPGSDEAAAAIRSRLVVNLMALGLAALVGGYLAWIMGGRVIVAPAMQIMGAARRLKRGNLEARIALHPLRSSDEFARIAAGFNLMADSLQQRQKELEAELGHSRQAYATLETVINSMQEGLMAVDAAGSVLMCNEAAVRMLGLDETPVPPEQWPQRYGLYLPGHDEVCSWRELPLYRALQGESGALLDFVVRNAQVPAGRLLRASYRPMKSDAGITGALAVFADITQRVQAEKDIQEHLFTLQRAADASSAIVLHKTLQGTLQEVVEQARAVIRAHQGIVSLTVGNDWSQAVSAVSLSEKYAAYRDYVEDPDGSGIYAMVCESNRPMRLTQQALEAHPRWRGFGAAASRHPAMRGWLAVPLVSRAGENMGVLQLTDKFEGEFTLQDEYVAVEMAQLASIAIDNARLFEQVTELNASLESKVEERTAELTRQEKALRQSNQELEAFSYSVSHDLRSPLSAIDGFSRLLARQLGDQAREAKVAHYLARIQSGVAQMGELIEDLLSLAQVSRANVLNSPVDLTAISREILSQLQAREISRSVWAHVQDGLVAQGDPRLIRIVLDNLLGNAWKFTSRNAEAEISVGQLPQSAVFFVRDNGAGFDMAYADKLFGVFQRLHSGTDFPGTGIGLATVNRIVLRHQGKVWAEASPGQGATFYFTFGGD